MKKNFILILLACLVFFGALAHYLYRVPSRHYSDFRVYYKAGQDILHGKNIYVRDSETVTPFKYSPFFAFVFAPLSLLPIKVSACVFLGLNFIATVLLFLLSYDLASDFSVFRKFSDRAGFFIYLFAFACLSRYVFLVWESGQVNIIMAALVLLAVSSLAKDRQPAAGAFLAAAILIKYTPAIFLPFFIFIRKPKIVLWTALFTAGFLLLPALLVGFEKELSLLRAWIPSIISTSLDHNSYTDYKNQSIFSMILRFCSPTEYGNQFIALSYGQSMHGAYFMALLFYAAAFIPSPQNPDSRAIDVLLIIICTILFNPNCWMTNFVALAAPFVFLLQYTVFNKGKDWLEIFSLIAANVLINFISFTAYIYSLATLGAIVLFLALVIIKFFAKSKNLIYAKV
jgi:hypothetical protein